MIFDAKHEMIRKLVRQFAETELTTEVLDKVEETGEFPEEIVDKMAKCGFLGLKIPREYGGAGADTLAYVIMIEEIARVSAVASLYANTPNSLGGGPLMQAGTPEQLEKYLRPSVENKVKIVFGLTGTGYFDLVAYQKFNDHEMTDTIPTDEQLAASIAQLPKVEG